MNKVNFQLLYSFIFETRRKYFKCFKYFYNSLEKVEKTFEEFLKPCSLWKLYQDKSFW